MDADIPENYVAQLSGHKNSKSLDSYKTASDDHQRKMSLTLSRTNTSVMPSSSSSAKEDTKKEKQPAAVGEDVLSSGLFSGSTVLKGCTFNFNFSARPGSSGESFQSVLPKRKHHVCCQMTLIPIKNIYHDISPLRLLVTGCLVSKLSKFDPF